MGERDAAKQREYVRKYQAETVDRVTVRPTKGTKDRWREAADRQGQSLQQYIIRAVEDRIQRESEQ